MHIHRYHCKIILRNDAIKTDGTAALAIRVLINGKKTVLPIGMSIHPHHWNTSQQKCTLPGRAGADINLLCDQALSRCNEIFIRHRLSNIVLTVELFKISYLQADQQQLFLPFAEKFINDRAHTISPAHYNHSMLLISELKKLMDAMTFADINFATVQKLDLRLKKSGKGTNTVAKYHQTFRTIILAAEKCGLPVANPYKVFRFKKVQTDRVVLSEQEVRQVIHLFENQTHHSPLFMATIAAWVFSATCGGFRLSDLKRLTTENIVGDVVVFQPYKTRRYKTQTIKLKLPSIGRAIIAGKQGQLFELPADQVCNRHMKDVAYLCGIEKNVTMHTARHTFATQYLEHGGKVEKLQRILGHSRINDTMTYVHMTDKSVQNSMDVMDIF